MSETKSKSTSEDYNFLANPTLVDPLGAMSKGLTAANAFNENQLYQAKKQAGEAFQSSINPDGSPNQAAFLQNIKRNPAIAPFAQNAAQGGETLDNAAYGTLIKRLTSVGGSLMGLAGEHPNGIPKDVLIKEVDRVASLYGLPPASAEKLRVAVTDDPRTNLGLVFKTATGLMDAGSAAAATVGTAPMVNTGPAMQQFQQPGPMSLPVGGRPANVPMGMSPGEATTPRQIGVDPVTGAPIWSTHEQFVNRATPPGQLGTGRFGVPPALTNPNAQPAPGAPAVTPSPVTPPGAPTATPAPGAPVTPPGGGIVTGLGPGEEAAKRATGTQSAGAFQTIAEQGTQAQQQRALLNTMLADTAQFTTGPLTERVKNLKAWLQQAGRPFSISFGIDAEKLAANESFDKFAAQLANAQGATSDARLAVNQHANPSSVLTPGGVDLIIRQLTGNADYLDARARMAASWPNQADRQGFENQIGRNLDPRVFQYERMTPEQKHTFYTHQSDKRIFEERYKWAKANGMLTP